MSEKKKFTRRQALKYAGGVVVAAAVATAGYEIYQATTPGPSPTTTAASTGTTGAAGPIKIGFISGLTGPAYYSSALELIGAQTAIRMENDQGGALGRKLELIIADDQADPTVAVSAMQRLIQEGNVVGITGETYSFISLPLLPVVHQYHIPWVNAGSGSDTVRENCVKDGIREVFFIATPTSTATLGSRGILKTLAQQGKVKNVAVIRATDEYDLNLWKKIKPDMDAAGINTTDDTVDLNAQDFTSLLLKYKSASPTPDMLMSLISGKGAVLVAKQAKELDFAATPKTPYVLDSDYQFPVLADFWSLVGQGGLYWTVPCQGLPAKYRKMTPLGTQLFDSYQKQYGAPPGEDVYDGFDSAWALVEGIKMAGSTDPDKIISALEQMNIPGSRLSLTFPSKVDEPWQYHNIPREWCVTQFQEVNQAWDDSPIVYPPEIATTQLIIPKA